MRKVLFLTNFIRVWVPLILPHFTNMAFSTKEQELIKWGLQNGKSSDEIKEAITRFRVTGTPAKPPSPASPPVTPSVGGQIVEAAGAGVDKIKSGFEQSKTGTSLVDPIEAGLKVGAGAAEVAFSPLAPLFSKVGQLIGYVSNKIADNKAVQGFAMSPAGEGTSRVAEDVLNATEIAGVVTGGKIAPRVGAGVAAKAAVVGGEVKSAVAEAGKVGAYAKSTATDIIPTKQRYINHQIAEALDFTPGDLNKISRATGNDVGQLMSENNLIGVNRANTETLITDFFKKSYDEVRVEIGRVDKSYKQYNVPRYVDALTQIQTKVKGIQGLEKVNATVDNLLHKTDLTLADVQLVKELMDEHFNLYKVTGDVGEGVAKQGLATIRADLKTFIEKEVKATTGSDIAQLNNNVSTARSIIDVITTRSQAGLTRSNINRGDVALAFFGVSFPLVGLPLLALKKIYESPTMRLRVAKWLDGRSDAQRAAIMTEMKAGKVPPELNQVLKEADPKAPGGGPKTAMQAPTLQNIATGDSKTASAKSAAWPTTASKPSTAAGISTGSAPLGKEGVSAQKAGTSGPFEGTLYRGG